MKVIKIERPNHVSVVEVPIAEIGENEILIKVMASGICGTDIHILRGKYLGNYPVIPGHEFSGIIEAVGRDVTNFHPGERVAVEPNLACGKCSQCLANRQNFCENWQAVGVTLPGGMAEYAVVPEASAFNIAELPFEHGALMEPLSCVLHGIEQTGVQLADKIVIIGAGPIGNLLLQIMRLQGVVHITIVEKRAARASLAKDMGADCILSGIDKLKPNYYDVVVDATGDISLMACTTNFVRRGGTVLLFGVPPRKATIHLDAFEIFHKGLRMLSSFTSVRNSQQALALLQSGRVDVSGLISHKMPLAEFQKGVEMIESAKNGVNK
ncbi:MAG: zinc-dependent alcohol dehydrogenase family protein, partial [Candidatus Heimdallarchaeota archaeon]|nr:zinc-dependent alcohol dehydrogenase family protein [Candidatus Heimdallarchaeota archaeon]